MMLRRSADQEALSRSASRARDIAQALGRKAVRDAEIHTTYTIAGQIEDARYLVTLGCTVFDAGLFRHDVSDWLKIELTWPTKLPSTWTVRPPWRTVFQWRDGEPGEAPTRVTAAGVPLVVEGAPSSAELDHVDALVDELRPAHLESFKPGAVSIRDSDQTPPRITSLLGVLVRARS